MDKAQKEKLIRNVVRTMKWAKWGGYFEVTLGWLALAFSLLPFTLGVLYFGLMLFSGEKHWDWQAARSSVEMVLVGTIPLIVLGIPWYAIRISHKKACGIVFAIVDILHDIRFGLGYTGFQELLKEKKDLGLIGLCKDAKEALDYDDKRMLLAIFFTKEWLAKQGATTKWANSYSKHEDDGVDVFWKGALLGVQYVVKNLPDDEKIIEAKKALGM